MDGLKVERKIERGERRGTRVGTLAAAVRDTLGVEGGREAEGGAHELLTHSLALFLAQLSEVISEGRVIHGPWWSQLDCQESAQMQTFSTPRENVPSVEKFPFS